MDLLKEDLMNYWYLWTLAALFFGSVAFSFGFIDTEKKIGKIKCFLRIFCIELAIAVYSALYVTRWVKMEASFRWIIYEHAPKVYITVIAFVCILVGYLAGMAFARKKA